MIDIKTLKCLVTPIMILNLVLGVLVFIIFVPFIYLVAVLGGGFYIAAGVFGLIGLKPGKKWAFIIFTVLETINSISSISYTIALFDDDYYYYDDVYLVTSVLTTIFIVLSTIFAYMFLCHPDANKQVFQVIYVQQPIQQQQPLLYQQNQQYLPPQNQPMYQPTNNQNISLQNQQMLQQQQNSNQQQQFQQPLQQPVQFQQQQNLQGFQQPLENAKQFNQPQPLESAKQPPMNQTQQQNIPIQQQPNGQIPSTDYPSMD